MDALDFAIVRQVAHPQTFQWNVRLSYSEIARGLGADEETVRIRVHRLQEQGVLAGWRVALNPAVLGRCFARFDLPPVDSGTLPKVEKALRAVDGAILLFESFGGRLSLVAYQQMGSALDRQKAFLSTLAEGPVHSGVFTVPAPTNELAPLDWRILDVLRANARAPFSEVATQVGTTERTLRRRVDRMTEGRAVFLNPEIDFSKMSGSLPCRVRVVHRDTSRRREIDDTLRALPGIVFQWFEGPISEVSFIVSNLNQIEILRRGLEAMAGDEADVSLDLVLRRVSLPAWLDDEIARRAVAP